MKIRGVDHTSFTVANLARSLAFYRELLGFELLWEREIRNAYFGEIVGLPGCVVKAAHLRIPGSNHKIELFEYVTPPGLPAAVRPNNPGSAHLALYVEDLVTAYDELSQQGAQFRSPPVAIDAGVNRGGYALYLLDPDGVSIELFQPPAGNL